MGATTISTVSAVRRREAWARVGLGAGTAITGQLPLGSPVEDTVELSPAGIALSRAEVQSRRRFGRVW